jgi:hypothetical protein
MLDFALTQPNLPDYCLRLNVRRALFGIAKIAIALGPPPNLSKKSTYLGA